MDGGFEGSNYKVKGFELKRPKMIESMDGERRQWRFKEEWQRSDKAK